MHIGFFGLLTVLFIGLKLMEVISWSWLWVLAPLWGPFVVGVTILLLPFIIFTVLAGPRTLGAAVVSWWRG